VGLRRVVENALEGPFEQLCGFDQVDRIETLRERLVDISERAIGTRRHPSLVLETAEPDRGPEL